MQFIKIKQIAIAIILLHLFVLQACKTKDVTPIVVLDASDKSLDAEGGTVNVIARLNGPVYNETTVDLLFEGTAELGINYNYSSGTIVIKEGKSEGFITLTGVNSGNTDIKKIDISILAANEAIVGSPADVIIDIVNCTSDRDGDGINDCEDECPDAAGPIENNGCPWLGLIINEILYDPPTGINGDSNNDGTRQPQEDEFIELFNSNFDLDISGYTISDADAVRHTFPQGSIVPMQGSVVIFGGGNPTGSFGGSLVQTASTGRLSLNRGGDIITIRDAQGTVLDVFNIGEFEERAAQSYTKNPDITGNFSQHSAIPEAEGSLFSPGTKLNGEPFLNN